MVKTRQNKMSEKRLQLSILAEADFARYFVVLKTASFVSSRNQQVAVFSDVVEERKIKHSSFFLGLNTRKQLFIEIEETKNTIGHCRSQKLEKYRLEWKTAVHKTSTNKK